MGLLEYIIDLLPDYIIDEDSLKDGQQKGFIQRYMEIFGLELDEFYYSQVTEVTDQIDPFTARVEMLEYIGFTLGDIPNLTNSEAAYRRFLSHIISIYKIKGTIRSFEAILYTLGVDTIVTEIVPGGILYDNGITYDSGQQYDRDCEPCSDYDLDITGPNTITADLYNAILGAIALVEPINADLATLTYNLEVVEPLFIEVTIDGNGDLVYDNANDPGLVLTLDAAGDLIVSGPQEGQYYIDDNGDLIYLNLT